MKLCTINEIRKYNRNSSFKLAFFVVLFSYITYNINPSQTSINPKIKKGYCTQEVQEMGKNLFGPWGSGDTNDVIRIIFSFEWCRAA